jgi:hypothetical protein
VILTGITILVRRPGVNVWRAPPERTDPGPPSPRLVEHVLGAAPDEERDRPPFPCRWAPGVQLADRRTERLAVGGHRLPMGRNTPSIRARPLRPRSPFQPAPCDIHLDRASFTRPLSNWSPRCVHDESISRWSLRRCWHHAAPAHRSCRRRTRRRVRLIPRPSRPRRTRRRPNPPRTSGRAPDRWPQHPGQPRLSRRRRSRPHQLPSRREPVHAR